MVSEDPREVLLVKQSMLEMLENLPSFLYKDTYIEIIACILSRGIQNEASFLILVTPKQFSKIMFK